MGVALGWVVVALAGVAAAPAADRNKSQIEYTIQYVETEGLGWRGAMLTQLKPVARQAGATVWTAPQWVAKRFLTRVTESPTGKIFQTPKVTGPNGGPVHITSRSNHDFVTQVAWTGDDHAAEPVAEKLRTGWMATVVGRRLDQGILVQLVLEDTEISAVHSVKVAESCAAPCEKPASAWVPKRASVAGAVKASGTTVVAKVTENATDPICAEDKCVKAQGCCETAEDDPLEDDADVQQLTIAVPEIRTQEVAGEWLIPKDEVLLVSFGVYTTADRNGKAVVKERLAMIRAAEIAGEMTPDRAGRMARVPMNAMPMASAPASSMIPPPATLVAPAPVVVPAVPINPFLLDWGLHAVERAPLMVPTLPASPPMPVPAMPSRSIPEGVHKDGTISNLPPLPDEIDEPASESSEPMASPQKKRPQPKPDTDSKATKASYVPPAKLPFSISSLFLPGGQSTPSGLQFLMPIKPFSIKLPFGQRLDIEVMGRLVPDAEPGPRLADQRAD
jgi:hypothetical protein